MVARTPPKHRKMLAPLNPTLLRETLNKVDKCMERLQELQYTVTGGRKVISGVSLSPRSTRGYLRTSLRCKQESLRIKNATPPGKLPTNTGGEWRRMSLPAMLLGETVLEILQASQFAREIVAAADSKPKKKPLSSDDPRTPANLRRNQRRPLPENSELRARRKREKQLTSRSIRSESNSPPSSSLQRAKSRINFKASPPHKTESDKEDCRYLANRVSPRNRPWARKAVLFPNPLFNSSPTSHHQNFHKTKSPIIARNRQTPHKFLIKTKSPPPPPPSSSAANFQVKIKSPGLSLSPTRPTSRLSKKSPKSSMAAKLRRSFSPSRLANRLVSPLKSRRSVQKSDGGLVSGLKQRPNYTTKMVRFSGGRII